jgi:putative ABC transport system substrate-binding protein
MRRREFIGLIGGAGLVWPFAAHAQPSGPVRRIGVLMNRAANDPEGQARLAALQQGLEQAGWSIGRNVQIDLRWGEDDLDLEAKHAAELVALAPDLIFASGTLSVAAVKTSQPYHSDCFRRRYRSAGRRLRRQPGAAGR